MKRPSYQLKLSRNGAKFPDFQQNNSAQIEKKTEPEFESKLNWISVEITEPKSSRNAAILPPKLGPNPSKIQTHKKKLEIE